MKAPRTTLQPDIKYENDVEREAGEGRMDGADVFFFNTEILRSRRCTENSYKEKPRYFYLGFSIGRVAYLKPFPFTTVSFLLESKMFSLVDVFMVFVFASSPFLPLCPCDCFFEFTGIAVYLRCNKRYTEIIVPVIPITVVPQFDSFASVTFLSGLCDPSVFVSQGEQGSARDAKKNLLWWLMQLLRTETRPAAHSVSFLKIFLIGLPGDGKHFR